MPERSALTELANALERTQRQRLAVLSILEATTLVLLIGVAAPLKHFFGWPLGSRILGPIHGVAFLAFTWSALQTGTGGGWKRSDVARLLLGAFVPFAGFFNFLWLQRRAETSEGGAR